MGEIQNLRIEKKMVGAFTTYQNNPFVEKVVAHHSVEKAIIVGPPIQLSNGTLLDKKKYVTEKMGRADVYYYGKEPISVPINKLDYYQCQFGLPVSADGSLLYVMNWEIDGVIAYEIATGRIVWKYRPATIGHVFVYENYVIAHKALTSIIKFDWKTGEVLGQLKSGTIYSCHRLTKQYVLICYRGKWSIVDTETMEIVKQYSKKETSPLLYEICYAEIQGDKLLMTISDVTVTVDYDL